MASYGEIEVSPAKTRIAFMGQVGFAGGQSVNDRSVTVSLALPHALRSERLRR